LIPLCSSFPYLCKNKLRGKSFQAYAFQTKQLKCLVELYNLFYDHQNKKVIKKELFDYLNYEVLAH